MGTGTEQKEVKVIVPTDVLLSANIDQEHIGQAMLEALAYDCFADGRLSGGKAAKLAGMSRIAFLCNAYRHNVDWLSYSKDEVRRELSEQ